jgi:hypothetical protein
MKQYWTISRSNQAHWQKSENGVKENASSDGYQEFLVATLTRVANTLTSQK